MRRSSNSNKSHSLNTSEGSSSLIMKFFESTLGPRQTPKKKKRKQKTSRKEEAPVVRYNQSLAKMGDKSKSADIANTFLKLPQAILKVDDSHFESNQMLKKKMEMDYKQLNYSDLKGMLSLDFENSWQYKIILEGGLLLCQMSEIHKERDTLAKYVKKFIKKEVRNRNESFDQLQEMAENITGERFEQNEDLDKNPLIQVLIDALVKEVKRVKEAYQEAKEKVFESEK